MANECNTNPLLNDIVKINDKRFSFISTSEDKLILHIVLFDLYNNNNNVILRFYSIDLYNLYNYKIYQELTGIIFNNFLTLSLSVCNSLQCDNKDTDSFFTIVLFLSYINSTDYNLNITSYFSNLENNNIDNDDIYLNFPNQFKIDNNIFGYSINQNIKIISIPDEINLYKINEDKTKTQINIGDEYSPHIKLLISPKNNMIKNSSTYYIEYQYQYTEPDYETFNEYTDSIYDYSENSTINQKDEFNNDIKTYYGRILKIAFKLCNEKCKTCKSIGKSDKQTKCEECKPNLKYYSEGNTNEKTCFSSEVDCPEDFPFLQKDNYFKCLKTCGLEDIINDKCFLDNTSINSLNGAKKMFSDIIANHYNNEDIVLKTDEDLIFHLSNTLNEKESLNGNKGRNYNLSIIDLGECEVKLKKANNLNDDVSLILFKVETFYENTTIKNVQYEIYNPVTKTKITYLSPCNDEKIYIYTPTKLDNNKLNIYIDLKEQGYDIFNPNDIFYNDICTKYSSVNNTDLTLNDRKDIFYNGSNIFCQNDCQYQSINSEILYAKCECSASSNTGIDFDTKEFSGIEIITSFYDVIKYSNFLVLKCYKLAFSSIGIKNNFGFIIMIIFICFLIIMMIIFLFTGMNTIRMQMTKMVYCSINKINSISQNSPNYENTDKYQELKKKYFQIIQKKEK